MSLVARHLEANGLPTVIVGSARAIGAADVARTAAAIEAGGGDLAALEAAIAETCRFIAEYLDRPENRRPSPSV